MITRLQVTSRESWKKGKQGNRKGKNTLITWMLKSVMREDKVREEGRKEGRKEEEKKEGKYNKRYERRELQS